MYIVETNQQVDEQVAALPTEALARFAEVQALLEIAPWSGASLMPSNPAANMLSLPFGRHGEGLAIYLVLEG